MTGEHVLTPSPVGIHIRNGRVERELTGHRCAWNDAVLRTAARLTHPMQTQPEAMNWIMFHALAEYQP